MLLSYFDFKFSNLNESREISKRVVITGTLLIWLIKYGIRPLLPGNEAVTFFLYIAPNLLGSFLIPFGACWFFAGRDFRVARIFRIRNYFELGKVCTLGFLMLVINEYLQRIPFFGRTFDVYDILFSAVGLGIAYFVYSRWLITRSVAEPNYYDQQ